MAASSSSDSLGTHKFNELVVEGRKLAGYFFLDAYALDREVYGASQTNGPSCQSEQQKWWQNAGCMWSDTIQTGRAGTTFQTVSKALGSLSVGCDSLNPGASRYSQLRTVDTGVMPNGRNIPIDLIYQYDQHRRRYETIFNVIDGVIAVTGVETDQDQEGSLEDIYSQNKYDRDLSVVLGAVFFKLHRLWNPHNDRVKAYTRIAKTMVAESIKSSNPLPALPQKVFGSWLPAVVANNNTLFTQIVIECNMRKWLNYVIVHVNSEHETFSVIGECLRQHQINNVATLTWEARQIYEIGQWEYYALLGSNLGRSVAWLLARHKDPEKFLGNKAVRSITLFHADCPPELSVEEARKYNWPVLLFEIVDVNDEIRHLQKAREMAWTANPDSACHSWYTERVNSGRI